MNKQFIQNQIKDYVINNLWDKIIKLTKNNEELTLQNQILKLSLISCIKQIFIIKQNYNISIPLIGIFNKENEKMKNEILKTALDSYSGKRDNYSLTKNSMNNSQSKVEKKILSERKLNNKSPNINVNANNNSKEKKIYSKNKNLFKDNFSKNNNLYINSTSNNPTNATFNLNFNKISINLNNESEIKRKENKNIHKNSKFIEIKTYQSKFPSEKDNFQKKTLDFTSNCSDSNYIFINKDKSNLRNNKTIIYQKIRKNKSNNKSMPKLPLEQILGKNQFLENI